MKKNIYKNEYSVLSYFSKGNMTILESLEKKSPMQFKDLRDLVNPQTSKKFSSATVASSLKELQTIGAIKNEVVKSKRGNKLAYAISGKGKEALHIIRETEEKLEKVN